MQESPKSDEQIQKTCFIATPIGPVDSQIRRDMDGMIKMVYKPILTELGYKCISPLDIKHPGSITSQVIDYLVNAEMVIVNLTGLNPNVMYELAVRHAARKPVVTIIPDDIDPPFDIRIDRAVNFRQDLSGVADLGQNLMDAIRAAEGDKTVDNPIYRAITRSLFMTEPISRDTGPDSRDKEFQKLVLKELDSMRGDIAKVTGNQNIAQSVGDLLYPSAKHDKGFGGVLLKTLIFRRLDSSFDQEKLWKDLEAVGRHVQRVLPTQQPDLFIATVSTLNPKIGMLIAEDMRALGWQLELE